MKDGGQICLPNPGRPAKINKVSSRPRICRRGGLEHRERPLQDGNEIFGRKDLNAGGKRSLAGREQQIDGKIPFRG